MDFHYGARPRAFEDHGDYASSKADNDHLLTSPRWAAARTAGRGGGTSAHSNLHARSGRLESSSDANHAATDKRAGHKNRERLNTSKTDYEP